MKMPSPKKMMKKGMKMAPKALDPLNIFGGWDEDDNVKIIEGTKKMRHGGSVRASDKVVQNRSWANRG